MPTSWCEKLIDKCDAELDALSKKPDLDDNNLQRLKRWSQSLQALETVKAMRDAYPHGYAESYGGMPYHDTTYGRGSRYPRMYYGDEPRDNWPRDMYGHADSTTLSKLHRAMSEAKTDRERDAIRRAIRDLESV